MSSEVKVYEQSDITKVETNILNEGQMNLMLARTPEHFKQTRPAKGGGTWTYVSGAYIKKVLNFIFGWNWDFTIIDKIINIEAKQVIIHGRLTCKLKDGNSIVKDQFGRADIKFNKKTQTPLDLGNDLKAATTDALKKCASELGIASDVYAPKEFKDVKIHDPVQASKKMESMKNFINKAESIQDLERMKNDQKDEETQEMYDAKFKELSKIIKA